MPKRRRFAEQSGVWVGRDGVLDDTDQALYACRHFFMYEDQTFAELTAELEQYKHSSRVAAVVSRLEAMERQVEDAERAHLLPLHQLAPDADTRAQLAAACDRVRECVRECVWARGASGLRKLLV